MNTIRPAGEFNTQIQHALRGGAAGSAANAPGKIAREADSAQTSPGIPPDIAASPDLLAAYKVAQEAREQLLAAGRVPTLSAADAARMMALLS